MTMLQNPKIYELVQLTQTSHVHDIELQSLEIYLFHKEEFKGGQIGYRYDDKGSSLIGTDKGDWQESWIVIGYETDLGDPIFVDTKTFRVYTAEHGAETWEPVCIANHIDEVIEAVRNVFFDE